MPDRELHFVFDGPPSHEMGRFIEVEDHEGKSVSVGEWRERPDGYWELVLPDPELAILQKLKADIRAEFSRDSQITFYSFTGRQRLMKIIDDALKGK